MVDGEGREGVDGRSVDGVEGGRVVDGVEGGRVVDGWEGGGREEGS